MYHVFSLTVNALLFIDFGLTGILITNPRDLPNLIKELKRYRLIAITGVNTLFNSLLQQEELKNVDFHN